MRKQQTLQRFPENITTQREASEALRNSQKPDAARPINRMINGVILVINYQQSEKDFNAKISPLIVPLI